jgi:hypothetical protein
MADLQSAALATWLQRRNSCKVRDLLHRVKWCGLAKTCRVRSLSRPCVHEGYIGCSGGAD